MADESPYDDSGYELDDENDGSGTDSKNFADLRKFARKMEREAKAAQAKVEELSAFKAEIEGERRTAKLTSTFAEVGLSPKHAELFAKVNPDAEITPDAVRSFASEYELAVAASGEVPDAPAEAPSGFNPVVSGTPPTASQYTLDDVKKALKAGRDSEVKQWLDKGLVEKEETPWTPYAPNVS